jgi:hypothetical protein
VSEPAAASPPEEHWRGFADESYGQHDYYVAIVVTGQAQEAALKAGFDALRKEAAQKWKVPSDVEFHAYDIMQGCDDWKVLRGRVGDAASLYRKLLKVIVASGAKVAIEGVGIADLAEEYDNPPYAHEAAARLALEQVDQWCADAGVSAVEITADEISSDMRFATDVFNRAIDGTTVAASDEHPGSLGHVAQPIALVSSASSDGVQAADLVAHIVRRHFEETSAAPRAVKLARSLYHTLLPALTYRGGRAAPKGVIGKNVCLPGGCLA